MINLEITIYDSVCVQNAGFEFEVQKALLLNMEAYA